MSFFAKTSSTDGLDKRAEDVMARLSGAVNALAQRGRCKTCGGDGHLTFEVVACACVVFFMSFSLFAFFALFSIFALVSKHTQAQQVSGQGQICGGIRRSV